MKPTKSSAALVAGHKAVTAIVAALVVALAASGVLGIAVAHRQRAARQKVILQIDENESAARRIC